MTPTGSKKRKYDEFAGNDQKEEKKSHEVNEPWNRRNQEYRFSK